MKASHFLSASSVCSVVLLQVYTFIMIEVKLDLAPFTILLYFDISVWTWVYQGFFIEPISLPIYTKLTYHILPLLAMWILHCHNIFLLKLNRIHWLLPKNLLACNVPCFCRNLTTDFHYYTACITNLNFKMPLPQWTTCILFTENGMNR